MFASLILATLSLSAPIPKAMTEKEALKALHGEWSVTSGHAFGRADDLHTGDTLAFDGASLVHLRDGKPIKYRITLSPNADPARIDWMLDKRTDGSHRGIYKLDADALTICLINNFDADDDKDRPTEFTTRASRANKDAAGTVMLTLERKK